MSSARRDPTKRRLPLGLVGMVVLIASAEREVARHHLDFTEKTPASWRYSVEKAKDEGARAEVLCLGSSLIKFGVHPSLIERATARSSFNLGVYGGRIASSYFLLKRVLARGRPPEAVVLEVFEGRIPTVELRGPCDDLALNRRNWEELLTVGECLDLSWQARDADFLAATLVAMVLPSVRCRFEVRNAVRDALAGRSASSRDGTIALIRNWNVNRGSQVMPTEPHAERSVATPSEPPRDRWENHRLLEIYTRRFMDLASARGIRVFWIMPPLSDRFMRAQERSGFTRNYLEFIRGVQDRHPNLVVIDGRHSGYGSGLFHDATHLNEAGMSCFSRDLAVILARQLDQPGAQPRWCAMPRCNPESVSTPFENLTQSRVALFPTGTSRY